jgi:hypothetical protein
MSMDASWDLRSTVASPKSLCVYTAAAGSQETNPFEVAAGAAETPTAQAVVFGTEKGSLHYRTYPAPSTGGGTSSNVPSPPLGASTAGRRPPSNLPRAYLPVDLAGSSLPGAVVGVLQAKGSPSHRPVFLVLVDDNRGSHQCSSNSNTSASSSGHYATLLVTLQQGSFSKLPTPQLQGGGGGLPRVSCATYHARCGFVMAGGRRMYSIPPEAFLETTSSSKRQRARGLSSSPQIDFSRIILPSPGARGGQDALLLTSGGKVAVVAVGNSVYAVAGREGGTDKDDPTLVAAGGGSSNASPPECVRVVSFAQSSQVHPVIVLDIQDPSMDPDWSSLLCANGRECAVIDIQYAQNQVSCAPPRNGMVTISSPILAAATSWPWLALLTSDGLISIRSPSCLAIPLKTVEVGQRPNDFFVLRSFHDDSTTHTVPYIVAGSYSGQAKVLHCQPDTAQDLADRLMRHSIDAFGSNGFPRSELAEALHASFTATSYVGPEPINHARDLLRQYLEAILGLADFEGGGATGWPTERTAALGEHPHSPKTATFHMDSPSSTSAFADASRQVGSTAPSTTSTTKAESSPVVTADTPNALVAGTALLCLVCTLLTPSPKAHLANRAAKACAAKMGVLVDDGPSTSSSTILSPAAIRVCELVTDRLLSQASIAADNAGIAQVRVGNYTSSNRFPPSSSSQQSSSSSMLSMEFVEASTWLLRSCGKHERAIDVLYARMQQQVQGRPTGSSMSGGFWSPIKYDSYTATHLGELWATCQDAASELVLRSPATTRLLEQNPRMGLNVFTILHPQNASEWKQLLAKDDPLAHPSYPSQVAQLLKGIQPKITEPPSEMGQVLPMDTGRALAVAYLESAVGVDTGRPTEEDAFDLVAPDEHQEERIADFHDELCYLLLEGVISERGDDPPQRHPSNRQAPNQQEDATELGEIYRQKLRRFLQWPLAKVRSERLLGSLPKSFLQEQALVLGRLGKHEEALRILYIDCKSMDLALEYCDMRYERQQARLEAERARLVASGLLEDREDMNPFAPDGGYRSPGEGCAYLPLVKVALESDVDKKRGTTAAIQVLALRRSVIDRAAALRLLPKNVPVAAVARPFLIPALVESESQARRLKVVSSLLRARHNALKQQLTDAQLKAQAHLHVVPQLRSMNLGDPLHSSKAFKARPSSSASSTFPDVVFVKHFFPRHVVIQAKVTNSSMAVDGRALGNVAFVVAESSEEAIQPSTLVPIKVLPFKATGSTWCVLVAAPSRMEGTAILTCELRYTVLGVDSATGTPLNFGAGVSGRTFVEELQDLEVVSSNFS